MTAEEAARRLNVRPERLADAESGERPLTLNQARKAADVYKRPLAALFLPEPPREESLEVQFRRLRDAPALPWPPQMRALARAVPALQDEADALFESLEQEPQWSAIAEVFARFTSPDEIEQALRDVVGVSIEAQKRAAQADPQGFRVFRLWREAIEDMGILVIQDGSLTLEDMRGFAAPHARVPAIVINTQDDVRARLFTMLHELAHLFLAVDDEMRFEEFAASVLLPVRTFPRDLGATAGGTLLEKVDAIARAYGVTPAAAAVRVGWLRLASWDEVNEVRGQIQARATPRVQPGGGNYYRNVIVRMGPRFVSRVLEAASQSAISELAASRLLNVKVDNFDNLRREVQGPNVA
jgi:Zn-dependent peptidase ImmA (M78 family)